MASRRSVSTVLFGTMVEARWLEIMVSSDHPLADERVAEAIARVLSRSWVDAASGFEVIMTHRGANIAYLARAAGLSDDAASSTEHRKDFECGRSGDLIRMSAAGALMA
jgi:hypothetical protein